MKVSGRGCATLVFLHGFGCDQSMWGYLLPHFSERFRVVLLDHVGAGGSDLSAYCVEKYSVLQSYAQDLSEIIDEFAVGPVILVGHSVSAMIAALADVERPGLIAAHVMVGPSPCYIDAEGYTGGFKEADIQSLTRASDRSDNVRSVGLGLFIVREITTAHGGTITVSSTPDRGTAFQIQIPSTSPASLDS